MDKLIERVFELTEDENKTRMLVMHSRMEGEYGTILCQCTAQLNGDLIVARVVDQAEPDGGFSFRSAELAYFLLNVLPLFKPQSYVQVKTPPQSEK